MTNRVQVFRTPTTGVAPAAGTRASGELWVNFADFQLGMIDAAKNAQKLIAVRFFSTTANYAAGDFVIQAGKLYFAAGAVTSGAFNSGQWTQVAALTDIPALYVLPTASTSVLGGVKIDGTTITINSGTISSAGLVTVSSVAPSPVQNGALWYDLVGGQLYAWVNDGTSSQWVVAVNQSLGGVYLPLSGGTLTGPLTLAADPTTPFGAVTKQYSDQKLLKLGVVDGSDAPAGQIGEIISSNVTTNVPLTVNTAGNITSISLTAGDWDVCGEVWSVPSATGGTAVYAAINTVSGIMPSASSLATARSQMLATLASGALYAVSVRPCRVSLVAAATYYLVGQINGAAGNATGNIWARRAR